jgi:hypothetical protein
VGGPNEGDLGTCPHSCLIYLLVQAWGLDRTVCFVNTFVQNCEFLLFHRGFQLLRLCSFLPSAGRAQREHWVRL